MHRVWPYTWWPPSQKYRIYTVYIWFWPTLDICIDWWTHTSLHEPNRQHVIVFYLTLGSDSDLVWHITRGLQGGYKDGLQPETLADGNWLVKQHQPVSRIETKSDTSLGLARIVNHAVNDRILVKSLPKLTRIYTVHIWYMVLTNPTYHTSVAALRVLYNTNASRSAISGFLTCHSSNIKGLPDLNVPSNLLHSYPSSNFKGPPDLNVPSNLLLYG